MKKIALINSVCTGSTGKIMGDIQRRAEDSGYKVISFFGRGNGFPDLKCIKFNNKNSLYFNILYNFIFNKQGLQSKQETEFLIQKLEDFNPDIIHLHNVHGYYLNYQLLFDWINTSFRGKIVWTLHDCWTFTGHCAYFSYVKCQKWKNQCSPVCPMRHGYPYSFFVDTSKSEYDLKKEIFTFRKDFEIVTPSNWLNELVKQSFLKKHHVQTINNGINLSTFKPDKDKSIKQKYGIPENKKIILGVANIWEKRKGLDDFLELSRLLMNENIVIILVGLSNIKKQLIKKYKNVIGIERTENVHELVKIYSISDIFVNLTKEDNYPTVNIESIACGTPVITYDTGGCKEQVINTTGYCCTKNTIEEVKTKILEFINKDFKNTIFDNKVVLPNFDANKSFDAYIRIYDKLLKE
ncbi:hypothetical protein B5F14_07775 [Faecalitalea cylindroides]|uniref:Glycosyl transferase n=1 Tax=Faecalitalea cylindroides TaxID=39483 RepID=A0A1Y4LQP9_9FIRM|nr:glycosyltransferase [Faecalitalea cylindroides]OUP58977.1 hypothetical protein B5F14_07775 [Faecalitalea cylindroides]